MAGIYIHIPFCKKACHYCDFHFSTSLQHQQAIVNAIGKELELRKAYLQNEPIQTIYFGGGTPSLLTKAQLQQILNIINDNFQVESNSEITLEANPDDLSKSKLEELFSLGINRLSIGVQSFFDTHLQWMNRAHNAQESWQCLQWAKEIGFENITIDLIYGIPQMTDGEWKENIQKTLDLGIPHISAYNLTVEEKTVLHHQIENKKSPKLDDAQGERNFNVLQEMLKANDYVHYEISNFGKEGYFSKHNTSYWQSKRYLGVGPSAHSFDGVSRSWNVSNNNLYLQGLEKEKVPSKKEMLQPKDLINEHLMIGLRNIWGCDWQYITSFGLDIEELTQKVEVLIKIGDLETTEKGFKTTHKGLLFADGIASDLFLE